MAGYEIRNTDGYKGKGLFATRQFQRNEVILEEDPLVSCQFAWNAAYKYLACDHCLRPLETAEQNVRRLACKPEMTLPYANAVNMVIETITSCDECKVAYCSDECKKSAFDVYHRTLCYDTDNANHPIAILLEAWKQMHYPPETTNIFLIARILAYIQQSSDPQAAISEIKGFCHRTVSEDSQLAHKLLGSQFSAGINSLRELMSNVFSSEYVQEFLTPDGFCSLLALIGTNGQGIGTSPLSIWVRRLKERMRNTVRDLDVIIDHVYNKVIKESGSFLNTEGSGIYKLQSACNHDCHPNAEICFPYDNHRLQLKTTRLIQPGDEICISYLEDCDCTRSRHSRQKMLAQNYLFICKCDRCVDQAGQPDFTSDEEMSDDSDTDD